MNAIADAVRAPSYRMSLAALLRGHAHPLRDVEIRDLTQDSRAVTPGAAFLACEGRRTHGLAHAADAVARGAVAVLWEPVPGGTEVPSLPPHVVVCGVPELARRLGDLADRFFREPSAIVRVAGITGTNGKTTTAFLLAQASELVGRRSSYLGTIGFGRAFELREIGLTTPDPISVHRRIAQARDDRAVTMAIEVSSHALDQQRVNGVRFDTAVFTNLSRDHLDYHGTEQAYAAAKARLFESAGLARAVINVSDPFGRELASRLAGPVEKILFTTGNELIADAAAGWLRLSELSTSANGLTLQVASSWGAGTLKSKLIGEFNAENLLAALGVLLGWGVPLQQALVALAASVAPPGRMEAFGGGARPLVLVDYAHSPDALAKVLDAARAHARGRLLCVFGCGGDRDPGKRPQMGAIAEELADVVFITNDNPRSEDPLAIVAQIRAGMRDP
ncbi:MAG TPA: UDP-N-acetylmuramoyl-L-alanyl-D-glutamate--2,6-diaminopimelate ligase, partial [Nannocystaceae bacterium]|nr:UDP-N-acetylmuramoyl-L-alanyl-D-glutamate--2,6-diaminopimelate ligase [Nannocystaceae bacterium]